MFSMITEPLIMLGRIPPKIITIGINELRRMCFTMTERSGTPFARAVRMKSWRAFSSSDERR